MKFLFDNESFSCETLRAAGFANHGGAEVGEVIVTARGQRQDYGTTIGWAAAQPSIDAQRIFVWGTSFAGMHATALARVRWSIPLPGSRAAAGNTVRAATMTSRGAR